LEEDAAVVKKKGDPALAKRRVGDVQQKEEPSGKGEKVEKTSRQKHSLEDVKEPA